MHKMFCKYNVSMCVCRGETIKLTYSLTYLLTYWIFTHLRLWGLSRWSLRQSYYNTPK